MALPVSITAINSFSPLGTTAHHVWQNYLQENTLIKNTAIGNIQIPAVALPELLLEQVSALRFEDTKYHHLDNSVLYSILASRAAVRNAGWNAEDVFGVNIGSSRGATQLFEKHYLEFIEKGITGSHSSPSTTLGNISSWVAQDLKSQGPDISHSITCSTSLHAVLNGIAWLGAGMADKFLVGGSEASLTPFTVAQMKAMKIYSSLNSEYPSRALDMDKTSNSMILGEGAASACLEPGHKHNALAIIEGIGYATEVLQSSASISTNADCMQRAMSMALKGTDPAEVSAIVMHAPGTIKGDRSELNAVKRIFGTQLPMLTTNKWKIGHTFGAAGILSLELAILMIQHNTFIPVPFVKHQNEQKKDIKKVLVNAVGFGGNAVSILVAKP